MLNKISIVLLATASVVSLCMLPRTGTDAAKLLPAQVLVIAQEDGQITVEARREGEDLVIDVSDNGLGMRPEVAASLLDEDRPDVRTTGSGIGVRNVHRRIRLTFGTAYGLTIFSEPDEGTTVRIRLPALNEEQAAQYQREEMT